MLRVFLRPSTRWQMQIAVTRQFSTNPNPEKETSFMDSFARKLGAKNPTLEMKAKIMMAQLKPEGAAAAKKARDQSKQEKMVQAQKEEQPNQKDENDDLFETEQTQFYMKMFNKSKDELMREWLESDSNQLVATILEMQKHNIQFVNPFYKSLEPMHQLMSHLDYFDDQIREKIKSKPPSSQSSTQVGRRSDFEKINEHSSENAEKMIKKTFGLSKSNQLDIWFEMTLGELNDECKKHGLIPTKSVGKNYFTRDEQINKLLHYMAKKERTSTPKEPREVKEKPNITNNAIFRQSSQRNTEEKEKIEEDNIMDIVNQASSLKSQMQQKFDLKTMIRSNEEAKESDSDLDVIDDSKVGPSTQLPRATIGFELPKHVSTNFYQHVPSLAYSFNQIAMNDSSQEKNQLLTLMNIFQNPFNPQGYLPEFKDFKLGGHSSVDQYKALYTLDKTKNFLMKFNINYSFATKLQKLKASPTLPVLQETIRFTTENQHLINLHPDLSAKVEDVFHQLEKMAQDGKIHFHEFRKVSSNCKSQFTFLEDIAHHVFKPENFNKFKSLQDVYLSKDCLRVPSVKDQKLDDLKSLSSILSQLVNVPIPRDSVGRVVGDQSDIDKFQGVIEDVQQQFRSEGMLPIQKHLEEIPIVQRTNLMLLFPSADAQMSSEMTSQLTELLMSIIKHNFRDARPIGETDITSQQLVYLAARVAQFYETNNDLVAFFRSKITDKIFPMNMNKHQLFTIVKTFTNDKSLLFGEKGLNDIQFFAGGHPGCKYDPFLKENQQLNAKEMKDIMKIGTADIQLLFKIFSGARRTLNATTVEDLDSILYMVDYMLIASPLLYDRLQTEQHVVRSYVNSAHQIADQYELPINIILRLGSIFNQRATIASLYAEELFQVLNKSETQHLKRDTDRDLLTRFNESLLVRICNDQIYDHNRHSFGYILRVGQPYSQQTFIIFNQQLKDLLDPEIKISPELEAIDNDIINQFLSSPIVAQRIFKDVKEAQSILKQVFKRNLSQLTLESQQKLQKEVSFAEQEQIVRLVAQRTEMINNMNIFTKDDKQLTELADRILWGNINQIGAIPSLNFDKNVLLPLEQLLKTNLAILQFCDKQNSSEFMKIYLEKFPMSQIIGQWMQNLFQDSSIDLKYFDFKSDYSFKLQVQRTIQETQWQTAQKYNSLLIGHFLYMLKFKNMVTANARVKQLWGMEDQAIAYLRKLQNCRTLHGKDLISLINLFGYMPQEHDLNFDKILLNITPVLGTLNLSLIPVDIGPRLFVEEQILAGKPQIIPTSLKFFADQLPESEEPPVIEQKSVIVPEFDQINEQMVEQHRLTEKKLFDLYKDMFERNNQFNSGEVNLQSLSWIFGNLFEQLNSDDQIMCLQILGQHVENYSESFITKLYDKYSETDQLAKLNEENPKSFYKLASSWPQFLKNNAIIDVLTNIRETNQPVHEQYEALKVFTDKKILNPDLIEAHFTSLMRLTDRQQVKKYLQHLIRSMAYLGYTGSVNMGQLTQVFRRLYKTPEETDMSQLLDFFVCMAISNPDLDEFEDKSRQFIEDCLNLIESMFTGTKSTTILRYKLGSENAMKFGDRPETPQVTEDQQDVEKFDMYYFQSIPYSGSNFKKNLRRVQNKMDVQMMKTPAMEKYVSQVQEISSDEDEENEDVESKSAENRGNDNRGKSEPKTVKLYDRKATDNALTENLAYIELRKNTLSSMTRKGKHLVVYSNFNQCNHYDLNNNNTAKAWAILFHFRSKSTESMLYEEFNAIAYRNSIAKTRSHDMFSQVYFRLLEYFSSIGVQLNLSRNCQQTGWPMDIHLVKNPAYLFKYKKNNQGQEPPLQNFALSFLLKEELCYNTKQLNRMEPLGLQKLMQKHLSTFGSCKVIFVNEDDVYRDFEKAIEKVKQSFTSEISFIPQKQTKFEDISINTTEQMQL